ncbi:MAG: hypothetical protein ACU0BK_02490 [Shimia sp.]|uniref:hypothetical protein n=1 Tax=Shimia sp. TaxID=1954381 RepID=UPI004058A643
MLGILTVNEILTLAIISTAHIGAVRVFRAYPGTTRWLLDFSSGLGLGYAFLYLLPKIGIMTASIRSRAPDVHVLIEHQLYFFMLFGFLMYYLVEFKRHSSKPSRFGLALNLLSFSVYSALLGATVVHLNQDVQGIYFTSAVVFTLHLFGVNKFLFRMYAEKFEEWMRWVFVLALFAGGYAGTRIEVYSPSHSVATALVGGIIIILSVRLKLPVRSQVNTQAFLFGVATAIGAVIVFTKQGSF